MKLSVLKIAIETDGKWNDEIMINNAGYEEKIKSKNSRKKSKVNLKLE